MFELVDEEIDMAGKFRVRIKVNGAILMLKFDEKPETSQLEMIANSWLRSLEAEKNNPEVMEDG